MYTKDQLLTNIMFYWAPNSIAQRGEHVLRVAPRDARVLAEDQGAGRRRDVPEGAGALDRGAGLEARINITQWTEMPRGGHFAALEQPELLLEDVRAFFRPLR